MSSVESNHFFNYGYDDYCVEALDACLTSSATLGPTSERRSINEPHTALNTTQEASNLSQDDLHSLASRNLLFLEQPEPCPPLCDPSPRNNAPTSNSPESVGYEKRSSQSTTSSPASNTAQHRCDFCAEPFIDVDSHSAHLIVSHHISSPFHCGRTSCSKPFKDERSLKRHLIELHLGAAYVCRCDRQCVRKDKHCKHLESNSCTGHGLYRCPCGHAVRQLNTHKHHIDKCGRKRRGRPPKHLVTTNGRI